MNIIMCTVFGIHIVQVFMCILYPKRKRLCALRNCGRVAGIRYGVVLPSVRES